MLQLLQATAWARCHDRNHYFQRHLPPSVLLGLDRDEALPPTLLARHRFLKGLSRRVVAPYSVLTNGFIGGQASRPVPSPQPFTSKHTTAIGKASKAEMWQLDSSQPPTLLHNVGQEYAGSV